MPSPFPGMNPYLEQEAVWSDFHQAFCAHLREILVPQVRPEFFVRLEEHLYIHELPADKRLLLGRADLAVTRGNAAAPPRSAAPTMDVEAPLRLRIPMLADVERSSFLEIRDSKDRALVALIELLSPSNKRPGPDREAFLAKRERLFASSAHYVEIDLLRGGPRMPIEELPDCDSYVLVSRVETRPEVGTWALQLRDPLPVVNVPLRTPRTDARIDLQAALHHLYDAAGYADFIYSSQPSPRLHPPDEAWAGQILATAGLP